MAVRNMVRCALFAALLTICAWLSVNIGGMVFSLQSFAVFLALGTLGGKRGSICVAVYLLLGAVGVPVFTGFQGGIATFFDLFAGYRWGFLLAALAYWGLEKRLPDFLNMAISMLVCYFCGVLWMATAWHTALWAALAVGVLPYLLPDAVKIGLALLIRRRLKKIA